MEKLSLKKFEKAKIADSNKVKGGWTTCITYDTNGGDCYCKDSSCSEDTVPPVSV